MAEKPYRWTVDAEFDFGGRTSGKNGLNSGIPRILGAFKKAQIKALFFISTEVLDDSPNLIKEILAESHEIGSHGHFHTPIKSEICKIEDKKYSEYKLSLAGIRSPLYRAPKFRLKGYGIYSEPRNHVSLLKHLWLGQKIKEETIMYLHPFDIVETTEPPPSLFCRLWYSRPKKAYKLFESLVNRYK